MSAGIPNFDHVGLKYAATLGAFLKNPEKGLKHFEDIDDSIKEKVYKFKQVQVHVDSTQTNLYVKELFILKIKRVLVSSRMNIQMLYFYLRTMRF